jgi:hypothetical protein
MSYPWRPGDCRRRIGARWLFFNCNTLLHCFFTKYFLCSFEYPFNRLNILNKQKIDMSDTEKKEEKEEKKEEKEEKKEEKEEKKEEKEEKKEEKEEKEEKKEEKEEKEEEKKEEKKEEKEDAGKGEAEGEDFTQKLKQLPITIGEFFSNKLIEAVKEIAKAIRSCAHLMGAFHVYKLRKAVMEIPEKFKALADGIDLSGGVGEALKFGKEAIDAVVSTLADVRDKMTKVVSGLSKIIKEELRDSMTGAMDVLEGFTGILSGDAFSFSAPSFDSFKDMKPDVIPEALKKAPGKLFGMLMEAQDATVKKWCVFTSALMSVVKPEEVAEGGMMEQLPAMLEDEDEEVQMASIMTLMKIGSTDAHKDEAKKLLEGAVKSEKSSTEVKAKAQAAILALSCMLSFHSSQRVVIIIHHHACFVFALIIYFCLNCFLLYFFFSGGGSEGGW